MKLIICIKCNDIFNLTLEEKTCSCGKSSGKYTDTNNAEIKGDCMPIGFSNQSFLNALRRQHIENKHPKAFYQGQEFTAFIIPSWAKSIKHTTIDNYYNQLAEETSQAEAYFATQIADIEKNELNTIEAQQEVEFYQQLGHYPS